MKPTPPSNSKNSPMPTLALMYYNLRCGLLEHVIEVASVHNQKGDNDESYVLFWKACCKGFIGRQQEAIHDLHHLRNNLKHLDFATIEAIRWFHHQAESIDHEELDNLALMSRTALTCTTYKTVLLMANFHLYLGNIHEADNFLNNTRSNFKMYTEDTDLDLEKLRITLWLQLKNHSQIKESTSIEALGVLTTPNLENNLDICMALSKYYVAKGDIRSSIDYLNKALSSNHTFYPALIEKAKILLSQEEFSQAEQVVKRAILISQKHFEAKRLLALIQLVSGRPMEMNLQDMITQLVESESHNAFLMFETSSLFSRLIVHEEGLNQILGLITRACDLDPSKTSYRLELAFQLRRLNRYDESCKEYQIATSLDDNNIDAYSGWIRCLLLKEETSDAQRQLEFLSLTYGAELWSNKEILYIKLLLEYNKNRVNAETSRLLSEVMVKYHSAFEITQENIIETYKSFDVEMITELARMAIIVEEFKFCGNQIADVDDGIRNVNLIDSGIKLLSFVTSKFPAHKKAWIYLVKSFLELNKLDHAQESLEMCLSINEDCGEAFILDAQIQLAHNDFSSAGKRLERALSINLSLQSNALYCISIASVALDKGDYDEVINLLSRSKQYFARMYEDADGIIVCSRDIASFYKLYSSALVRKKKIREALNILNDAKVQLAHGSQYFSILEAQSDLYVKLKNTRRALDVFDNIKKDSLYYTDSQMAKAKIYLLLKNDKKAYIDCFLALVRDQTNSISFMMLGDAYMNIQLPEKAAESFLEAYNRDNENVEICKKVGYAFWSCHKYQKAKSFYEDFLAKRLRGKEIRTELVKICIKLNDFEKALGILERVLHEKDKNASRSQLSKSKIDNLMLIAQVYKSTGRHGEEKKAWVEARSETENLLADKSNQNGQNRQFHMKNMLLILHNIATLLEKERDFVAAKTIYKETLGLVPNDKVSLVSLTRIYLAENNLDECQSICDILQRFHVGDKEVKIVLTEVFTAQSRLNEAIVIFEKFLNEDPSEYLMLSKYITVLWRSNRLDDVEMLLHNSKLSSDRSLFCAGYHYSRGLFFRYKRHYDVALECFNRAAAEKQWRDDSIVNMIKIYLNLDDLDFGLKEEKPLINKAHMRSVNILFDRLPETSKSTPRIKLLHAYYILLSNGTKNSASREFLNILEQNTGYIPALFGLAVSFFFDGFAQKARNSLKKIAMAKYDGNHWEVFEKSYVMLAESYIKNSNFDLSKELCERSILINRTNFKAWELLAIIYDEKQNHEEALKYYEKCWKLNAEKKLSICYKLSIHFIRQRRITDAIEIQKSLTTSSAKGMKLRNIIMNKCIEALRE